MLKSRYSWKIGGEAGFGIMVTGNMFTKICTHAGFWAFGYSEYPSLIRGGHNTFQVDFSREKVYTVGKSVDLLVALNKKTIDEAMGELKTGSVIIYDPDDNTISEKDFGKKVILLAIPFLKLAKDAGGGALMRNTVALGASMAVFGFDFEIICDILAEQFKKKGQEIIDNNIKTAEMGFKFVTTNLKFKSPFKLDGKKVNQERVVLTQNEAIGIGAIASGCKFFSAYPMTPINGLLSFMASNAQKCGFIYKQPEDEISGINMAIGASFAGARSLVATSGGGFSLMVEALGMAGMTETPIVVILGQRPGPSSGLPTWTGQGDLQFALNASQGDFPRIVLAAGDNEEAFRLTTEAFNLADIYQTAVIILADKFLCESPATTEMFNLKNVSINRGEIILPQEFAELSDYKRYKITKNGISKRAYAGTKGPFFVADSYEHDEYGFSTEDARVIKEMMLKRDRKRILLEGKVPDPIIYGPKDADITFVGWGSTKAPMLAALTELNKEKSIANYLHLTWLSPFPSKFVKETLKKFKKVIDIEGNISGQLARLIEEKTGIEIENKFLKFDGRPFFPEEIVGYIRKGIK